MNVELLQKINREVNASTVYKTDMELYNKLDFWNLIEKGMGDCEDYAITKRQLLINAGIPAEELKLCVCRTPDGQGHAVLTVDMDNETYILDNNFKGLKTYSQLKAIGYKFLMRQSGNKWVKINDT